MTTLAPKYRCPTRGWRLVSVTLAVIALILSLSVVFHWRPFGWVPVHTVYLYLLLALFLPSCLLWIPISSKASRESIPWYDIVMAALSAIIPFYFSTMSWEILARGWATGAPMVPYILSIILWVLLIEAGRRAAGLVFAIVVLFFSVYPLFASYMPGFLWGPTYSFRHIASFHILSEESLLGIPMKVFGELIIGFMVFAVVIQAVGAGKFFNALALALVRTTRAGNAKIAIISSGLFGTITGAVVPNVMAMGSFTIPAMKKEGLSSEFAAGVEASASAGGPLMPPVMGAAAFVMADFLRVPYAEVALAAAVPSVLYYLCLFSQIDAHAARIGLKPQLTTVEVPPLWRTLVDNLHILLGFGSLIFILFFLRLSAQSPWIATAVMIITGMLRKDTRLTPKSFLSLLEGVGRSLGDLIGTLGPIGLIVGGFIIAGVAYSLPHEIVGLAGKNVLLMLLFGAITSFILGMGVTLTAVYIFLAIVLAPGLIQGGLDPMAAHLFIMYTAMFSSITPPVALAAFAAASIAGADPMKTGWQACRLGIAKYILPFIFVFSPALILRGPLTEVLWVVPSVAAALIIISAALEGYFWGLGNLTVLMRVLLFGSGMLLVVPSIGPTLWGLSAFVILFVLAYLLRRQENPLVRVMLKTGLAVKDK